MAVQEKNVSQIRSAMSVSGLCRLLKMSRSQFYLHVSRGTFHAPNRLTSTGRPYFTAPMVEDILNVRETGMGVNGEYVLFYERRAEAPKSSQKMPTRDHAELIEGLGQLGLQKLTDEKVEEALNAVFPNGSEGKDSSVVLRMVFRHLKSRESA